MKFRVIQSNNRGLISKVGDKTFHSRKPKIGEEDNDLPTLFIWVNSPHRFVARVWTRWTGEQINKDFIYEVTRFKDVIDITGQNHFHLWSSQFLRKKLWTMRAPKIDIKGIICPPPEDVWEDCRHKNSVYLKKRSERIKKHISNMSTTELKNIKAIYKMKNDLNFKSGFIKYHVDHIIPLSKGGKHQFENLRIISAKENLKKGSKTFKKV